MVSSAKVNIVALPGVRASKAALPRGNSPSFSVIDLFSGAGGLSEGFCRRVLRFGGTDYDPDALATYASNFPEAEIILGDIRDADVKNGRLQRPLRNRARWWTSLPSVLPNAQPYARHR